MEVQLQARRLHVPAQALCRMETSTATASRRSMSVRTSYRKTARSFTKRGLPCARRYSQGISWCAATPMRCVMEWTARFTPTPMSRGITLLCIILTSGGRPTGAARRCSTTSSEDRVIGCFYPRPNSMRGVRWTHSAPRQWRHAQLRRDKDRARFQNGETRCRAYNNQRDDIADSLMAQKGASTFDYGLAGLGSARQPMSPMTGPTLAGIAAPPAGGVPGAGIGTGWYVNGGAAAAENRLAGPDANDGRAQRRAWQGTGIRRHAAAGAAAQATGMPY